jgi:hypothetical protein
MIFNPVKKEYGPHDKVPPDLFNLKNPGKAAFPVKEVKE